MKKDNELNETFELCGKTFRVEYFPKIYAMIKSDQTNAEAQIRSIADAWHEGDIISAAQALESDLGRQ